MNIKPEMFCSNCGNSLFLIDNNWKCIECNHENTKSNMLKSIYSAPYITPIDKDELIPDLQLFLRQRLNFKYIKVKKITRYDPSHSYTDNTVRYHVHVLLSKYGRIKRILRRPVSIHLAVTAGHLTKFGNKDFSSERNLYYAVANMLINPDVC